MWQISDVAEQKNLGDKQWHWLCYQGSLTHRLSEHFSDKIEFRLLFEGRACVLPEEASVLGVDINEQQWLRHIAWYWQGQCQIAARVVVPLCESDDFKAIIAMGDSSIGECLFCRNAFEKGPIEIAKIPENHAYYEFASGVGSLDKAVLWGRRRSFSAGDRCLLVSELFLPDFFNHA